MNKQQDQDAFNAWFPTSGIWNEAIARKSFTAGRASVTQDGPALTEEQEAELHALIDEDGTAVLVQGRSDRPRQIARIVIFVRAMLAANLAKRTKADDFRERVIRLLLDLHASDVLSEGQCAKVLDVDRISWRELEDEAAINDPALARPQDRSAAEHAGPKGPLTSIAIRNAMVSLECAAHWVEHAENPRQAASEIRAAMAMLDAAPAAAQAGPQITFDVDIATYCESNRTTYLVQAKRSDRESKGSLGEDGIMTVFQSEKHEEAETERAAWDAFLTGSHVTRDRDFHMALIDTLLALDKQAGDALTDWKDRCSAIVDIYDDARNNPPENRTYVDGSFAKEIAEVRAMLATDPTVELNSTPTDGQLLRKALNCPHTIETESVTLHFDPKQPGHNALNQLSLRLGVDTAPAQQPSESTTLTTEQREAISKSALMLKIFAGHDSGVNMRYHFGKDWHNAANGHVATLHGLLAAHPAEPSPGQAHKEVPQS